MPPFSVNYLAIAVAALTAFVLGAVWYSPVLFAKPWAAAHGYTEEKLASMRQGMVRAYAGSFVGFLVMAFVMAILMDRMEILSWIGGAKLGVLCWAGFAATIGLTANLYSDKPFALYLIDAGYQLVYMTVMGVILAVWQ